MSDFTWDDDYIPYASCNDCGENKIIPFIIKPFKPTCDGFCDCCGCPWVRETSKTLPNKEKDFQPIMPWGSLSKKVPHKTKLSLVISNKEVPDLKQSIADIFPSDYYECKECGYDHQYDATAAARKHNLV